MVQSAPFRPLRAHFVGGFKELLQLRAVIFCEPRARRLEVHAVVGAAVLAQHSHHRRALHPSQPDCQRPRDPDRQQGHRDGYPHPTIELHETVQ